MNIKPYIEYLIKEGIKEEEALKLLKDETKLNSNEKNLIYRYCYPRQLLDRELPTRVSTYRNQTGNINGIKSPDNGEITLLIEAARTEQYSRFIKHLMHAFEDPQKIFPLTGIEKHECPLCGKTLYEFDTWSDLVKGYPQEEQNKDFLAYGSSESEITLCSDCLAQLFSARKLINEIDPSFLDWTKRETTSIKRAWDALKLS